MGVSQEHIEPLILAKIQIYILTRAELLFTLCSEIPCTWQVLLKIDPKIDDFSQKWSEIKI